ncbi:hypothetical protein P170DRAFT_504586 [Aspergillus steynii IBT 23096]|uniref:Extracellular membrane protein CFEM domain-containing protein n=1 Tax=Aspergillus steynii IBT 23096 TaxID=1392250 RepID=A0A2I2GLB0_9EURO|nr:uncharacterized protein P170DRAFT_504586 [Aspergillus steynii IBT 23096]PLB53639.1 hypothetical protein P170DRAFT_504586 [Aspergillus steynii IBT 23096]
MATEYLYRVCIEYVKVFVRDLLSSVATIHGAYSIISEKGLTEIVSCTLKCLDLEVLVYDRLCAELDDPNPESCLRQCSDPEDEQHLTQTLVSLCQLVDTSSLSLDENRLYRRDLITPPTDTPTGKGHTRTRAPPKITSASPTHKITTLTELTNPPTTSPSASSQKTTNGPLPTSLITSASPSTLTESSPTPTSSSALPQATQSPKSSTSLSPGAIAGIAIGGVLLCVILLIALRCCVIRRRRALHQQGNENKAKPLPLITSPEIPEKHGNSINEIDGRVTAYPPGPIHDAIFELGGDPVVESRSEISDTPKFSVIETEGNKRRGETRSDEPRGV